MNEVFRLIELAKAKHADGTMVPQDVENIRIAIFVEITMLRKQIHDMTPELDKFEMRPQRAAAEKMMKELEEMRNSIDVL